jgi:ABC-type tungstate transport system permease subunit
MANRFLDWMISEKGQKILVEFKANGVVLYASAPTGVDPMNRVDLLLEH